MNILTNTIIKPLVIYIVQVGALWGLLEGYSYFKRNDLKNFLGSFWILIYILPLFTTVYVMLREGREDKTVKEQITTTGNLSPGKVGGNYSVGENPHQQDSSDGESTANSPSQDMPEHTEDISTKGDYSPGKVGKNYTVKIPETSQESHRTDESGDETEQVPPTIRSGKSISTKGNYSPGEVGGDYTVES